MTDDFNRLTRLPNLQLVIVTCKQVKIPFDFQQSKSSSYYICITIQKEHLKQQFAIFTTNFSKQSSLSSANEGLCQQVAVFAEILQLTI